MADDKWRVELDSYKCGWRYGVIKCRNPDHPEHKKNRLPMCGKETCPAKVVVDESN